MAPGGRVEYLFTEPGLPLNVDVEQPRPDHTHPLPPDTTVVSFTDGLIEHPDHPLDESLDELAKLATTHAALPLQDFVQALAILALRTPR
ncbi:SpoIIE family protein phosphatase [Streptomyces sp. NPDC056190]|uniref:SpoIIE family protein phosphatase n=1 Tax=unclassified Streptomyces TaxID=2593676 RepID=UPI0035D5DBE9